MGGGTGGKDGVEAVSHPTWFGLCPPRRRDWTGGQVFFDVRGLDVLEGLGNMNLDMFGRCGRGARGARVARCTGFGAKGGEGDQGIVSKRRVGEGRDGKLVWPRDDWRTSDRNRPRLGVRGRESKRRWIVAQPAKALR